MPPLNRKDEASFAMWSASAEPKDEASLATSASVEPKEAVSVGSSQEEPCQGVGASQEPTHAGSVDPRKIGPNRGMTKRALIKHLAGETKLTHRDIRNVLMSLENVALREIEVTGVFTVPEICRMQVVTDKNILKVEPRKQFKSCAKLFKRNKIDAEEPSMPRRL